VLSPTSMSKDFGAGVMKSIQYSLVIRQKRMTYSSNL